MKKETVKKLIEYSEKLKLPLSEKEIEIIGEHFKKYPKANINGLKYVILDVNKRKDLFVKAYEELKA